VYFDVHGCQMNTNDMEIAWSILQEKGYQRTNDMTKVNYFSFFYQEITKNSLTEV
jgi:tRNA A37 methylthiotransferase MiaB